MKTKIATALSIAGVLTAGSAAALVNTQILDSGPSESGASKAVLPPASSVELTVPDITVDTLLVETSGATSTTVAPTSSSSTTTTTTTVAAPAAAPDFLTAFNVGDAGVVTVDVVDGGLVLVSAEPKAGWQVTKAEDDSNDETEEIENDVEVEFVSATVRVEFEARFDGVRIVPTVESYAIAPPASPGTAAPRTTVAGQGGGEDDEYEDESHDEYEDDGYEDESHDEYEDESHEDDSHEHDGDERRDDD